METYTINFEPSNPASVDEAEFENLESTYTKLLNLKEKYGKKD